MGPVGASVPRFAVSSLLSGAGATPSLIGGQIGGQMDGQIELGSPASPSWDGAGFDNRLEYVGCVSIRLSAGGTDCGRSVVSLVGSGCAMGTPGARSANSGLVVSVTPRSPA